MINKDELYISIKARFNLKIEASQVPTIFKGLGYASYRTDNFDSFYPGSVIKFQTFKKNEIDFIIFETGYLTRIQFINLIREISNTKFFESSMMSFLKLKFKVKNSLFKFDLFKWAIRFDEEPFRSEDILLVRDFLQPLYSKDYNRAGLLKEYYSYPDNNKKPIDLRFLDKGEIYFSYFRGNNSLNVDMIFSFIEKFLDFNWKNLTADETSDIDKILDKKISVEDDFNKDIFNFIDKRKINLTCDLTNNRQVIISQLMHRKSRLKDIIIKNNLKDCDINLDSSKDSLQVRDFKGKVFYIENCQFFECTIEGSFKTCQFFKSKIDNSSINNCELFGSYVENSILNLSFTDEDTDLYNCEFRGSFSIMSGKMTGGKLVDCRITSAAKLDNVHLINVEKIY